MAARSRKALRNFPPVATSCCRAFRAMKLFCTFIEEQMARSPMRFAAHWLST